jgi:hypothetical protein
MRSLSKILSIAFGLCLFATSAMAYYNPKERPAKPGNQQVSFREACTTAKAQIDQNVNNVRARLTTGGDVWWDRGDGKYVVPAVDPGQPEVSSIFAGAVWLGGVDPGGSLKVAGQTYGNSNNSSDFWSGPLRPLDDPQAGTTDKTICDNWDIFFEVQASEVDEHKRFLRDAEEGLITYTDEMIPLGIRGWPGKRNPYFFDVHQFDLPDTDQGLAGFYDADLDGEYDPLKGDFPMIEIRKCEEQPPQVPDEMIFWIYNDEGGGAIHGETEGIAIRMEVQVQSFGYATNDQLNDMTFQRYKLINRAAEDIDSTYFAMWVDADLGCYLDDYIGCDTARSLAYTYNADAEDGQPGITCGGVETYGTEIPIIGIDYFRGPRNEFLEELGMSSFTYFNNPSYGNPPPGTTDPEKDTEFYNYLSGRWKDGTDFTYGGDAYNPGSTNYIDYAFIDDPDDPTGWSMCNPGGIFTQGLPEYDRRTVQASGPFTLQPGAVNELIIGAVWVPNLDYPCPDISRLQFADDLAQALFDNCFDITDGPDAPDVDWIELDQELVAVLTNSKTSNNFNEQYEEPGLEIPSPLPGEERDTTYNFEGYLLYQLVGPNVGPAEFNDPDKARLVYWVDEKNGVGSLFNWLPAANPAAETDPSAPDFVFYPDVKIEGLDQGIRHTFKINEDQFATGDRKLINHRKYYFSAKAYAYNNYEQFDPLTFVGQKKPYLEGRLNIRTYAPIPRPITDIKLNADYGDGPIVTRLDGVGVGGNFVDMSDETKAKILDRSFDGEIVYKDGRGPINISIFNPLEVVDGEYEITFVDENMANDKLDDTTYWQLTDLLTGDVVLSDTSIYKLNEQIMGQYGFTITIAQTDDVGELANKSDGAIGYEIGYTDQSKPFWFSGIQDGFSIPSVPFTTFAFNYVNDTDPHAALGSIGNGYFIPYQVADCSDRADGEYPFYITPAWRKSCTLVKKPKYIPNTSNVDIVMTPDKSLWSRCVVVETANQDYNNFAFRADGSPVTTEGDRLQFDVRGAPSVGKDDNDGDGRPDADGDGTGMGWFPGYAIDVETGKRLNIFFGENSVYDLENGFEDSYLGAPPTGRDMLFNPNSQILLEGNNISPFSPMYLYAGGQHFVYVTYEDYDSCAWLRTRFDPEVATALKKVQALQKITWAGFPMMQTGTRMESLGDGPTGLIPNEVTLKLRVDNPYDVEVGTGEFNGYPSYRFSIEGKQHSELDAVGYEEALAKINVVPNPYYAYSDYEDSRLATTIKITNLPAKCTVIIYSLGGKFIRQYNRDEQPGAPNGNAIPSAQIIPDLEWDLKNSKGIPIAAGVYLIHVNAPDYGERTIKWFGITRQFDPTGL